MVLGYTLGLLAMSPTPVLYYWMFAPAAAAVVAALCGVAAAFHRPLIGVALGASIAALFGLTTVLVFFFGLANQ